MRLRPKLIEKGDGYRLLELPIWVTAPMAHKLAENLRKDAAIRGLRVKITVGHRLMRVEETGEGVS